MEDADEDFDFLLELADAGADEKYGPGSIHPLAEARPLAGASLFADDELRDLKKAYGRDALQTQRNEAPGLATFGASRNPPSNSQPQQGA